MTRTTGARLAQIFVGYALIATLCAGGIYFGVRPTIQLQMQRTIDGEARGFRALYERVDPRTFGGIIATRVAVDAERGVHYSLRAPDGALVVGNVPDYAWTAPAKGGVIQFTRQLHKNGACDRAEPVFPSASKRGLRFPTLTRGES